MNDQDRRRLEQLCHTLTCHVEQAAAGTVVQLVVRLNRAGHIAETSGVIPAEVRPLGVESDLTT